MINENEQDGDSNSSSPAATPAPAFASNEMSLEEKFAHSQKQLHNAMVLAHLGPWEFDVINGMFKFNDTFYALFRTTVAEIGGYDMSAEEYSKRFVHPDDAAVVGESIAELLSSNDPGYTAQIEHRITYGNGDMGYIAVRFFAEHDASGKLIKTHGINQDITDYKIKEQTLTAAKQELEESVKKLEYLNKFMIDRELKMTELKKEVDSLKLRLGE